LPDAAASATGNGELMMRLLTTKSFCDRVAAGRTVQAAAKEVIAALPASAGDAAGLIALDRRGRIGVAVRGGRMPHAWFAQGVVRPVARMRSARA
jgi:isoaspartyl peptidase/L-asparaginase-like protein (Ntn-hydrolase superfamily)